MTWAQHFEGRGMYEEADAVYQKAVKNQAQPAETVLNEYRSQINVNAKSFELEVSGLLLFSAHIGIEM